MRSRFFYSLKRELRSRSGSLREGADGREELKDLNPWGGNRAFFSKYQGHLDTDSMPSSPGCCQEFTHYQLSVPACLPPSKWFLQAVQALKPVGDLMSSEELMDGRDLELGQQLIYFCYRGIETKKRKYRKMSTMLIH